MAVLILLKPIPIIIQEFLIPSTYKPSSLVFTSYPASFNASFVQINASSAGFSIWFWYFVLIPKSFKVISGKGT